MVPRPALIPALLLLASACAPVPDEPAPTRAIDFKPIEIRMPAVIVQFAFGPGEFSERERESLPREYEGAVLEGLNARAVLARDVRLVSERERRPDARAALARAREVQADHAVIVEVTVTRRVTEFCRGTRRTPLRELATTLSQGVEILRVSDGARRLALDPSPALSTTDFEPDCAKPAESQRRSAVETLQKAVDKLLTRLLGP